MNAPLPSPGVQPAGTEALTAERIARIRRETAGAVRHLTGRSTLRGLLALAGDLGAIAACIALDQALSLPWLTPLFVFLIGTRHYALIEGLCHNASHHTLFASRRLHGALEWLYAWPFFVDVGLYRVDHLEHHRAFLTGEDHTCDEYAEMGMGPAHRPQLLWAFWGRALLGYATLKQGFGYLADSRKVQATWAVMIAVALATGLWWPFVLYHVIPRVYVAAVLIYWTDVADHYRAPTGVRTNTSWTNLVTHNEGYHSIHHVHAGVPWFRAKEAHALVDHPHDPCNSLWGAYRQMTEWEHDGAFPECF